MSRIGKKVVKLPKGVSVKLDGSVVTVKGAKGELSASFFERVNLSLKDLTCEVSLCEGSHPKFWGLYRTLLDNMVTGVSAGFEKRLELQGVGYRASVTGASLTLNVGFSHPVVVAPPSGISFSVDKSGVVVVMGVDKAVVGQVAAKVRSIRPPEPYHGKGIRYVGEVVVQKAGTAAGKK